MYKYDNKECIAKGGGGCQSRVCQLKGGKGSKKFQKMPKFFGRDLQSSGMYMNFQLSSISI